MKLTSLEVKGFKSFADKTVVHFNENMTGIVGPNGCGKSNVVDAIRWVIGEQKARMLRSNKMEDLIFNGSKSRHASQLAEVSLTFENDQQRLGTEFSTVRITRMYFRDGESEYRINDVPCRLKDIHNLFLDTGVSSDSYAIIELKMIEEIITDKENSRRHLFEQAAGISKFKERKKETISKLESTQGDLNRVEDLLFEIEGNLKNLENQAKKTKKYYELKDVYKRDSIELAAFNVVQYKEQFEAINGQQEQESEKRVQMEAELQQMETALLAEKNVLSEQEREVAQKQKDFNELLTQIAGKEGEKKLAEEKSKFLQEKQSTLNEQIKNNQSTLTVLEEEVQRANTRREEIHVVLSTAQELLEAAKTKLDEVRAAHDQKRKALADENQRKQIVDKQYFEVEKEVAVKDAQKNSLTNEINQGSQWMTTTAEQKVDLEKQLAQLTEEVGVLDAAFKEAEAQEQSLQQQVRQTRDELDTLRQALAGEARQLDQKQNEYNLTKSMVDKLEGFPDSIKFLKQQADFPKDAPLLSDIIAVKEEYKAAVENLLEPYLNYYVVNALGDAIRAVNSLSDAKKGKANFFILEELKDFKADGKLINNAFSALSITESDARYQNLIHYLLGKVYFVDNIEEAPVKENADCLFLTTNAQYQRSRFSLSGGSVGLFEGKRLGRLKNLEKLAEQIEALQKDVEIKDAAIKAAQDKLSTLNQALQGFNLNAQRNAVNQKNNALITVRTKLENVSLQTKTNEERQAVLKQKIEAVDADQKVQSEKYEGLRTERDAFQLRVDELTVAYNDANAKLQSESEAFNQTNISFIQQQNQLQTIEQELQFKQNQIKSLQTQSENYQQQLAGADVEIAQLLKSLEVLANEMNEMFERRTTQQTELTTIEQAFAGHRAIVEENENKFRSLQKSKELLDQVLNDIKDKNNNLRLQMSSLRERLNLEFQIEIETLIERGPNPELDFEELQREVSKNKERIDKFGEINPMAVEAFEEMNTRYQFIIGQKNDLVAAKTALEQTMAEIESSASEKFMAAFTQIKANFIDVFQKLFNEGDQCDLYLENPNDVLDSRIEVVAKPKGKRPSTITQLSGGEKALTAIALLFSLYLLKPAPFCVLDEVDAPLDDNNVGKFNNMIREFSNKSQFIIVTHNKSTMASVDVIYGVTMTEPGVSRLVPVDFRSLN